MAKLPWLLVLSRFLLAPVLIALGEAGLLADRLVLALYLVAFATDYLDGVIARRLGVATPALRHADGTADTVFHLALAWVTWRLHPDEIRASTTSLAIFAITAAAWYGLDAVRWKRLAGFHALSAKAFSVAIAAWAIALYGGVPTGPLLSLALLVGALANVEGVAISLVLTRDSSDVKTVVHALRARHSSRPGILATRPGDS